MKLAWLNEKKCSTTPAAPGRRIIITFHSTLSLLAALGGPDTHEADVAFVCAVCGRGS